MASNHRNTIKAAVGLRHHDVRVADAITAASPLPAASIASLVSVAASGTADTSPHGFQDPKLRWYQRNLRTEIAHPPTFECFPMPKQ